MPNCTVLARPVPPRPARWTLAPLLAALGLAACGTADDPPTATAPAAPEVTWSVQEWTLPTADSNAAQPDLVANGAGGLLLSWIEPDGEGHALRFASYDGAAWSPAADIARGGDWFVNWADTPHVLATADGALWAHWLQKSAAATYAYDVALVRSGDGGASWSAPVTVNDDGTPTEHGFVSLWPASGDSLGIAWLDGRETSGGHGGDGGDGGHGGGAMTVRTARIDAALARHDEVRLDAMACDCCQTDTAMTARGPLLVYRDRTAEEVRDISVSRQAGGRWTPPRPVHADGWVMPACPVNGPAVAARGEDAVVGWYTAAGDVPTLKLARSTDAGDTFQAPVAFESGAHVQGRVDVALGAEDFWVLWVNEDRDGQSLHLGRWAPDLSAERQRIEVARLQGRGRGTGFPQMALRGDAVHLVWTDVVDRTPRLQGRIVRPVADTP
ncbi:sialidase family protein [Lysobacter sp. A3-1-A15]|uniref:sialidase family protein n=1 Tax=Novilysobacter viscosus TaxID=3098602 RepID=UPI002ED8C0A5